MKSFIIIRETWQNEFENTSPCADDEKLIVKSVIDKTGAERKAWVRTFESIDDMLDFQALFGFPMKFVPCFASSPLNIAGILMICDHEDAFLTKDLLSADLEFLGRCRDLCSMEDCPVCRTPVPVRKTQENAVELAFVECCGSVSLVGVNGKYILSDEDGPD
jgi:hypothetical protein